MRWFRRSRPADLDGTCCAHQPSDDHEAGDAEPGHAVTSHELVPVPAPSTSALARTDRALQMLAAQSAQLHESIVRLEHRVDTLSAAAVDEADRPSVDDVMAARLHSAKVAGELARLEVNIAARLEGVRSELRALAGDTPAEIDLRILTPTDTGWSLPA